jgi:hypothetical protein
MSQENWSELFEGLDTSEPNSSQREVDFSDYQEQETTPDVVYGSGYQTYPDPTGALPEQEPEEDSFADSMSEAERRLHKATLYRQFVSGRIFDGASDQLTLQVEAEFREFARHQLSTLLGIGSDSSFGNQFSDRETQVLKLLASRAIQQVRDKTKPQERKPVGRPLVVQKAEPPPRPQPRPQLRPRQLPEGARPQNTQPRQTKLQPQQPPPRLQPPHRQPQQSVINIQDQGSNRLKPNQVPKEGDLISANGRDYRIKWVPMSIQEYGEQRAQVLEKLPMGKSVVLSNGIQVIRTSGDEYFKIVKSDITKQVSTGVGVGMPDGAQMEAIMAMRSSAAIAQLPTTAQRIASISQ